MNLHQVIHGLIGLKSGERRRALLMWGVGSDLWPAIQECFDQEGNEVVDTIRVKLGQDLGPHFEKGKEVDAVVCEGNIVKIHDPMLKRWYYTDKWELIQTEE